MPHTSCVCHVSELHHFLWCLINLVLFYKSSGAYVCGVYRVFSTVPWCLSLHIHSPLTHHSPQQLLVPRAPLMVCALYMHHFLFLHPMLAVPFLRAQYFGLQLPTAFSTVSCGAGWRPQCCGLHRRAPVGSRPYRLGWCKCTLLFADR